jgi:hypothetical protein
MVRMLMRASAGDLLNGRALNSATLKQQLLLPRR